MTSHHLISSHRISPCNQPHYLTSPHNQPHFHISPPNHPHDIIPHHNTSHRHHRHTMETQPDTTKTPPDGTAEGWCAQKKLVWAAHWLVALRTFYRQIIALASGVFIPEASAPGSPGNYWQPISNDTDIPNA